MPSHLYEHLADMEAFFWSQVWRCTHKHPCQRCCWPWQMHKVPETWWDLPTVAAVTDPVMGMTMPAARFSLMLAHHALIFPGRQQFYACHQCDFYPCVNPSHLRIGTRTDNGQDIGRRGGRWKTRDDYTIYLPTGQPFRFGHFHNTVTRRYHGDWRTLRAQRLADCKARYRQEVAHA